jgi:nucleotide-binding universal stress UspA family protein
VPRIVSEGRVDLAMMGIYGGRSGNEDKSFFGGTAEAVVRTAGCPILTLLLSSTANR